jgi:mono/diheme cytochrome c family protein
VFAANCNSCHPSANAGLGPALHGPSFTAHFPDNGPLIAVIRNGRSGTAMSAFPSSSISDADLNALVAYLRSLK